LRRIARASGGIGRRAGFRCQCPQGRGGSSPPSRTRRGEAPGRTMSSGRGPLASGGSGRARTPGGRRSVLVPGLGHVPGVGVLQRLGEEALGYVLIGDTPQETVDRRGAHGRTAVVRGGRPRATVLL